MEFRIRGEKHSEKEEKRMTDAITATLLSLQKSVEDDLAKIDALEMKSFNNQSQIKELKQKEQQLLQFSLQEDINVLKRQIINLNNKKYFLLDSISQHKEINSLLKDEIAVVRDEFQMMVYLTPFSPLLISINILII